MCLARIVWYNLKRTREYEKQLKAEIRERRAANKARPKTHPTDRRNESAASQTAGDHPDAPTHPPTPHRCWRSARITRTQPHAKRQLGRWWNEAAVVGTLSATATAAVPSTPDEHHGEDAREHD